MKDSRVNLIVSVFGLIASACGDAASPRSTSDVGVDSEAAVPFEPAGPFAAPDPMSPGPFPVGVMTVDLFDDSRDNAAIDGPRFLRTEIWYPAMPSALGEETWSYNIREEGDDPNIDLGDQAGALGALDIGLFESQAVRDAPIDDRYGPYPVILFSHGAYSTRFQYNFHTVHLASHGYIVAAPDHTGSTLWDMMRDGVDLMGAAATIFDRVEDLLFVREHLKALDKEHDHRLQHQVEWEIPAGVSGHSLGGLTALMASEEHPEISFAVALAPIMDPALMTLLSLQPKTLEESVMILGSVSDKTVEYADQYCAYRTLGSLEKYLYELEGGGHFSFSDMCRIDLEKLPEVDGAPDILEDGCDPVGEVPFETAQQTTNHYAAAFFNRHVRLSTGSEAFLVDMDEPPFDAVNFYTGNDLPEWPEGCP